MPKIKDIVLVSIQLFLMLAFFLDVKWFSIDVLEHFAWFYVGLAGVALSAIALLQMNVHLSPFPTPKSDSKLITNGVFKFCRHPIYSGILIFMFSFSFWLGEGFKLEEMLKAIFPNYEAYSSKTGRFLPQLAKLTS
jgi:protein-S-isoprenylcysteine O-methyltransferase Ste14